jgi:alpha-methylacyl-CoA racemase
MRSFLVCDPDGLSPFYKQINGGKSVMRIDLKSASGHSTLTKLIQHADVLLESFRPGVMQRLGFGREVISGINPRLIHCAVSGFGQTGDAKLRAGHDMTYLAKSGMLNTTGTVSSPVVPFPPICDYATGINAATGILAGLVRRATTGKGSFFDMSLFETALAWQSFGMTMAKRNSMEMFDRGVNQLSGSAACYHIYSTEDGRFVALGAFEEKFWKAFCEQCGHPEWTSRQNESLPQDDLIHEVQHMFESQSSAHWLNHLSGTDCCFELVLNHDESMKQKEVQQRELVQERDDGGPLVDVLFPAWIDGAPPKSRSSVMEVEPEEALHSWRSD